MALCVWVAKVYRNKPSVAEILYPSDSYKFWEGAAKIAKETVYQAKNEDCTSLARCFVSGPLLGMMIHRMEDYIHHNHKEKRIFLYSGKNSNVAGLLSTFGAFDGLEPFFGSTVVVELHEFGWEYYVRVLYFRSSKPDVQVKAPEVITLQGCSEYCSFERFQELTRPLIPEDWEEECGFSRASPVHPAILHLMLLLVFLLVN
ncbi:venom acid phosphatase Acph-1-like [Uloborus diversus]|uniref:venom acid phosphatase Acph-1-like n=1 Tax=Uloborus diversus TaxID=327109 RepID=UPI002409D0D1|nr:venom acid phosphatase Acph-1-like [Uloborus diversus]